MTHRFVSSVLALLLCPVLLLAAELSGKVKSVDGDKRTITVTVNDKDQTFPVAKDATFFHTNTAGNGRFTKFVEVEGGLNGLKEGMNVIVTTEKKGKKEVIVSQVKVEGAIRQGKK